MVCERKILALTVVATALLTTAIHAGEPAAGVVRISDHRAAVRHAYRTIYRAQSPDVVLQTASSGDGGQPCIGSACGSTCRTSGCGSKGCSTRGGACGCNKCSRGSNCGQSGCGGRCGACGSRGGNCGCDRGGCGNGNGGCWPIVSYDIRYPANPQYFDGRDGRLYSAQGYGVPMAVPLAPNVEHSYNYGWGIPASRLTPISRPRGTMIYR